jgi:hypothetical protein
MKKFVELLTGNRVNLLIGAGTSSDIIPTLSIPGTNLSLVDLLESEQIIQENREKLIVYYYHKWVLAGETQNIRKHICYEEVLNEYVEFILSLINFLSNESTNSPRRINIFTTNFDPVFEMVFDEILEKDEVDCFFCDGGRGFVKRRFSTKNFYLNVTHSGYFDKYKREIPTINLLKMHGSITWMNTSGLIEFDPTDSTYVIKKINKAVEIIGKDAIDLIDEAIYSKNTSENGNNNQPFTEINSRLNQVEVEKKKLGASLNELKDLPIINPMSWKFEHTVFDENYYQLIRSLSYELENENSVLIALGSSFSDPHINNIIKRSLTNPKLLPIFICYDKESLEKIKKEFPNKQCRFLPSEIEFAEEKRGTLGYLTEKIITGDFDE